MVVIPLSGKTNDPAVTIMGHCTKEHTTQLGDFVNQKELSLDNSFEPVFLPEVALGF